MKTFGQFLLEARYNSIIEDPKEFREFYQEWVGSYGDEKSARMSDLKEYIILAFWTTAEEKRWKWGFREDDRYVLFSEILYIDSPEGQISFHLSNELEFLFDNVCVLSEIEGKEIAHDIKTFVSEKTKEKMFKELANVLDIKSVLKYRYPFGQEVKTKFIQNKLDKDISRSGKIFHGDADEYILNQPPEFQSEFKQYGLQRLHPYDIFNVIEKNSKALKIFTKYVKEYLIDDIKKGKTVFRPSVLFPYNKKWDGQKMASWKRSEALIEQGIIASPKKKMLRKMLFDKSVDYVKSIKSI